MWPFDRFGKSEWKAKDLLLRAGYDGSFKRMHIMRYSPADQASNAALHAVTNQTLLETLNDGHLADCIHITGKMNALADPFHRRLCAEVAKQGKTRFTVVYDGSVGGGPDQKGVAAKSASRWTSAKWSDKLSAVRLIGDEMVDLWAGPTKSALQYTVFGGRYTQLQGEHVEVDGAPSAAKLIWLIDSEEVNGFLTDWAKTTLANSRDIREGEFRDFFTRTNGVAAHEMMATLSTRGPMPRNSLVTSHLLEFDPQAGETLDGLEALGLVSADADGTVAMTGQGSQFIAQTA